MLYTKKLNIQQLESFYIEDHSTKTKELLRMSLLSIEILEPVCSFQNSFIHSCTTVLTSRNNMFMDTRDCVHDNMLE